MQPVHYVEMHYAACTLREDALCSLYTGCTVVQKTINKIFFVLTGIFRFKYTNTRIK